MQSNLNISGLWIGSRFTSNGQENFRWSLSLTNSSNFPSAFGASAISGKCVTNILVGTWSNDIPGGSLDLRESIIEEKKETKMIFTYNGNTVNATTEQNDNNNDSSICIVGIWRDVESGDSGRFICKKENSNDSIHISGLWIGEAIPDISLKEFYLPTNPIRWSLTVIRRKIAQKLSCPAVFGSGYFDDAADIKDQPVICYSLTSSELSEVKKGEDNILEEFYLSKVYEFSEETNGVKVYYSGKLLYLKDTESYIIQGTWKNEWAGSFGQFSCSLLKDLNNYSTHQLFCKKCSKPICFNEYMYECNYCEDGWYSCDLCYKNSSDFHQHNLIKEIKYKNECAKGKSCAEIVLNSLYSFADRPFIGLRDKNEINGYKWLSYKHISSIIYNFYYGFKEIIDKENINVNNNEIKCLIIGDLSTEYIISILCTLLNGLIIVPIDGNIDNLGIEHVIKQINPLFCIIENTYYSRFYNIIEINNIKTIVYSQNNNNNDFYDNTKIYDYHSIIKNGLQLSNNENIISLPRQTSSNSLIAILFTSGSSGYPKGAAYTENLVMPAFGVANVEPLVRFDFQKFHPSFIVSLLSIMRCGGRRAISTDLSDILESISYARPTHISAPPVLFQLLYSEFQSRYKTIIKDINTSDINILNSIKEKIAKEVKSILGNRIISLSSGGASISQSILSFCNETLHLNLVDLYGSRETGPIAMNGIVYSSVEVRVIPLDDMNLSQGEIIVHSPRLIKEYVNDEDKTLNAFININGKRFYKTGDYGEVYTLNGNQHVRILDRLGFTVKMQQGEWLSPARIEVILETNKFIHQAAIFGSSKYTFPIAIIIPSKNIYDLYKYPFSNDIEDLKLFLLKQIRFCCIHHHIKHIPRIIHIQEEPWTIENGFLTATLKKRRKVFIEKYESLKQKLYSSTLSNKELLEDGHSNNTSTIKLSDKWLECLSKSFPNCNGNFPPNYTLCMIGADSLHIARLERLIFDTFNISISKRSLFEYSIGHLNDIIEGNTDFLPNIPCEISWDSESILQISSNIKQRKNPLGNDILLTGCTGFFGPVLLGELLISLNNTNRNIYCLMRDNNIDEAYERLQKAFILINDPKYYNHDKGLDKRIKIILGDLGKSKLGLSNDNWNDLLEHISIIYHSGAIVNLILPYSNLKQVNVGGTSTIINLAIESGASIQYISSVSVLSDTFRNEDWIPLNYRTTSIGYGATKIISEKLLYQAKDKYNIPVNIFRISTISGHQKTGYFNPVDFTGLLLAFCIHLKSYVNDSQLRLQWLPVDYVAKLIISISNNNTLDNHIFHLCGDKPDFINVINIFKELGYELDNISQDLWKEKCLSLSSDNKYISLANTLANLDFKSRSTLPIMSKTKEILDKIQLPFPIISNDIIKIYIKYMKENNII